MLIQFVAHAAGLGKLNVLSGLGEPLKAEIEIMSATAKELSSLTADIASNDVYIAHGIEKPSSHQGINIQLGKSATGKAVLKLSSTQPITDAFLDMLIQVDWSSGRLLREYTVLLDPPGYKSEFKPEQSVATLPAVAPQQASAPSQSVATPIKMPSPTPGSVVKHQNKPVSQATKTPMVKPIPEPVMMDSAMPEYMTQRGDTLYAIAKRMKPEGVSLEQMLVGLYQENQRAFSGKNMNRLKVGQIIRAPSSTTLNNLSNRQAKKKIRVHTANWRAYKNRLAGVVKESEYAESATASQSNSGKVVSAKDSSDPVTSGPKDVVKLSAGDAKAMKSLEDKVASLEEEMTAKDNAVKEAESRTADLEKQIADMQKLLALKNDAMAKIQDDAIEQQKLEQQTPDNETQKVAKASEAEVKQEETPDVKTEMAKKEAEAKVENGVNAAKEAATEKVAKAGEAVKPEAKPAETKPKVAPKPKPKAKPVVVPEPIEEPSFIDSLLGTVSDTGLDLPKLGMGAGALALLGGSWWFLRNRRRTSLTSFEEGIMTTGGLKANTVFGNTAGGTVDTGDTSFLTDFSSNTAGSMIDSHDVDPIAEAEVYMAYGRDAQAEEILKDAIAKEPERYELHLKLLEIYQNNKDAGAFEAVAGEMYTKLGANDATWQKVAAMGLAFDESNPLYSTGGNDSAASSSIAAEPATEIATVQSSTPLGDSITKIDEPLEMDDLSGSEGMLAPDAENVTDSLNLDPDTIKEAVEESAESDFDLDIGELNLDTEEVPDLPDIIEDAAKEGVDAAADSAVEEVASSDAPEALNFEMPDLDIGAEEVNTDEAVEVKLDDAVTTDAPLMPEIDLGGEAEPQEEAVSLDMVNTEFPSLEVGAPEADATDMPDITLEAPNVELEADDTADAGTLDLSGISLDIGDDASVDTNAAQEAVDVDQSAASSDEPAEVETKLDLVQAYIDMEDKVGAKELLDEVMNEGGENQKKRASELLAKIS